MTHMLEKINVVVLYKGASENRFTVENGGPDLSAFVSDMKAMGYSLEWRGDEVHMHAPAEPRPRLPRSTNRVPVWKRGINPFERRVPAAILPGPNTVPSGPNVVPFPQTGALRGPKAGAA